MARSWVASGGWPRFTRVSTVGAGAGRRRHLSWRNLGAGAVVGAFLIPEAMAYGALAGISPSVGVTVALFPLLVYPLVGRNRWMNIGPDPTIALIVAATVGPMSVRYGISALTLMGILGLFTGALLLAARLARIGFVADLLSKPVIVGYLTGVAIVIVISQVGRLLGDPGFTGSAIAFAGDVLDGVDINPWAALVAVGTLVIVGGLAAWRPRLPGALIALGVALVAGLVLPVDTLGSFGLELPAMEWGALTWSMVGELLPVAAVIALLSFAETMTVARSFADGEHVDGNREMAALGACDAVGGVFGAYPMSASQPCTAMARASSATSRYYAWFTLVVVAVAALAFAVPLSYLPQAALAGVVVYAAWVMVDRVGWRSLIRMRWAEAGVAVVCAAGVVVLGVLPGVGIAIALSVIELLLRLSRPHEAVLGIVPGLPDMHDIDDHPAAIQLPGLVAYRYDSPLFFANANDFFSSCLDAADSPGCRWFILSMEANVEVDSTGLDALIELHDALHDLGIRLVLARVRHPLMDRMRRYGVVDIVGEQRIFPSLADAVVAYREWSARHPMPAVDEDETPFQRERHRGPAAGLRRFARSITPWSPRRR